ncbi:protein-disulfide reductase DsbD family protein [Enterovibrio sp. 27052020O]|uniref:protein-disulfide reductase DsbD family protein n=1 Tax=Enterovibrio sp. 27052020O TaxID=3241166 RepID=UPI00388FBC2D
MQAATIITRLSFMLISSLCLALLLAMPARSESPSTAWLTDTNHPPLKSRVVITGAANPTSKTVDGFLEIQLEGDWKTYWRTPGEGGVAPSLNWQVSTNIKNIEWHWPAPERFDLLGIDTLGYKHNVVIPLTFTLEDFNQTTLFKGTFTLSSCTTICVLTDYPAELTFNPNELEIDPEALHRHAQGMSQVPQTSPLISHLSTTWDKEAQQLEVVAQNVMGWTSPDVLIDGESQAVVDVFFSVPYVVVSGNTLRATFDANSWISKPELGNTALNVTFIDENFLAEQSSTATHGVVKTATRLTFFSAIFFALLGGLILNIMPCVLPVLGIKLSGVVTAQGLEKTQIRRQFIASALGILFSFWVIAAFLSVLKLTGHAFGWGVQFQSPLFLGLMVTITALFAANMLGLFEIHLPSNVSTWMASKGDNSYVGHFTQGMFATLLATPCSAPFLGTAVAFALTTNTFMLFVIFTALAIGMSLPWLLVATFPSVAQRLPQPGHWMKVVKVVLGFMMLATTVWLLTLLTNHVSTGWVILLALVSGIVLLRRTSSVYGRKVVAIMIAVGIIFTAIALVAASLTASRWATPLPADIAWERLSEPRISKEVAQGRTVFVDVTADWCISCQANKIGVLLQEPVYSTLGSDSVIAMQGNWTVASSSVTQYLQKHGRFGVPFNIVYGPGAPQGIPLPVILSSDAVLRAIDVAKGKTHE